MAGESYAGTVRYMSSRLRLRVLLVGLITLGMSASVGAAVFMHNSPQGAVVPSTQSGWAASINLCEQEESHLIECVARVWTSAYKAEALPTFYTALDKATAASGLLSTLCHESGHLVGRTALSDPARIVELFNVGSIASGSCNNGFLHGVLDKFAHLDPTPSNFAAITGACEQSKDFAIRSACNDGLGHSAWQSYYDVKQSTQICLMFKKDMDREQCIAGVVMQMMREDAFTGRPPAFAKGAALQAVPVACKEIMDAGATLNMYNFCYRQAAFPLIEEIGRLSQSLLARDADRSDAALAPIAKKMAAVITQCDRLGEEHIADCKDSTSRSITWVVGDDADLRSRICVFVEKPYDKVCSTARARVELRIT